MHVEEVTLRHETVSESLIWALCISDLGVYICRAEKNHSVFWRIQYGKKILQVVYVDDIVITKDDTKEIDSMKKYLQKHFQNKNLGSLKYFLSIEVARAKKDILQSQKKYTLTCFGG